MMKVLTDPRVEKWLNKISKADLAQVKKYINLFQEYQFGLGQKYLKKIDTNLWELRPGSIRLFFIIVRPNCIIIHAMIKKSQRMTKETKKIIEMRTKEYI